MKYYITSLVIASCAVFNIIAFYQTGKLVNGLVAIAILLLLLFSLHLNRKTIASVERCKMLQRESARHASRNAMRRFNK
jgi:hypothetical protein